MRVNSILFIISCFATFISCQKEVQTDLPDNPSTGTASGDYQPTGAGSEWNYFSTSLGNYTMISLGTDSLINGSRYYKFDRFGGGTNTRFYINKSNAIYQQYAYFPQASQPINYILLKDSAVGTTWTNIITASGFSNYHTYTVAAKGIQKNVNGTTFNNVIELDYHFQVDDPLGGPPIDTGDGKNYYAKDVGAIESFHVFSFFGIITSDTTRLTSYIIR